ncbi:hypothetical protein IMCC9480_76 [Oxalobacteraceae bacterium IMCC9480]|nr:hypothetical protein IMCC9480_76 [Oxalobacteraceae bacterium IMCC9480]
MRIALPAFGEVLVDRGRRERLRSSVSGCRSLTQDFFMSTTNSNLANLVEKVIGADGAARVYRLLTIPAVFASWECGQVSRKEMAQALNMVLFHDLLQRVPSGRRYTEEVAARGDKVWHDHGALRTVRWLGNGALPPGESAFTRLLEPLGYRLNGVFPLGRIGMTGRSYVQQDCPDQIAQFFVSELHPEKFSVPFQDAVTRVVSTSRDPLSPKAHWLLHELGRDNRLSVTDAISLLAELQGCFACQHAPPALADYELLRAESAEMAWIATEGNTFNHVTDRVADVTQVALQQKVLKRPMKETVEVSQSGRIRQTAFLADSVVRRFVAADGTLVERDVPGSFYEFISRDCIDGSDQLDLGFDAGNAQGIFKMTAS